MTRRNISEFLDFREVFLDQIVPLVGVGVIVVLMQSVSSRRDMHRSSLLGALDPMTADQLVKERRADQRRHPLDIGGQDAIVMWDPGQRQAACGFAGILRLGAVGQFDPPPETARPDPRRKRHGPGGRNQQQGVEGAPGNAGMEHKARSSA